MFHCRRCGFFICMHTARASLDMLCSDKWCYHNKLFSNNVVRENPTRDVSKFLGRGLLHQMLQLVDVQIVVNLCTSVSRAHVASCPPWACLANVPRKFPKYDPVLCPVMCPATCSVPRNVPHSVPRNVPRNVPVTCPVTCPVACPVTCPVTCPVACPVMCP